MKTKNNQQIDDIETDYEEVLQDCSFNGNPNLKPAYTEIRMSDEQVEEYWKCAQDPIYFIRNYVNIVSVDDGVVLFDLRPYQERMINSFHENRNTICRLSRQVGKCVAGNSTYTVKNKNTGEIKTVTAAEFHNMKPSKLIA